MRPTALCTLDALSDEFIRNLERLFAKALNRNRHGWFAPTCNPKRFVGAEVTRAVDESRSMFDTLIDCADTGREQSASCGNGGSLVIEAVQASRPHTNCEC
jgi:hypothetical protein